MFPMAIYIVKSCDSRFEFVIVPIILAELLSIQFLPPITGLGVCRIGIGLIARGIVSVAVAVGVCPLAGVRWEDISLIA